MFTVPPAAAWEPAFPGGEANAVLLADSCDVVTAGIRGDTSVESLELAWRLCDSAGRVIGLVTSSVPSLEGPRSPGSFRVDVS